MDTLFVQRTETQNALDSIDYRIKGCMNGIDNSIQSCQSEIAEKETEKAQLEQKFSELCEDPEYVALLDRIELNSNIEAINIQLESLRNRRSNISEKINSIKNPPKNKKKNIEKMSDEEKSEKIEQLKSDLALVEAQIKEQEDKKAGFELEMEELNLKHPPVETLQGRKSKLDSVCSAYLAADNERTLLQQRREKKLSLEEEEKNLKEEIKNMPDTSAEFIVEKYSPEEQEQFSRYKGLLEAMNYINDHPNGGNVISIIRKMAADPIASEIKEMEKLPVVIHYNDCLHRKDIEDRLQKVQKNISDTHNMIKQSEKSIKNYEAVTSQMPLEEAKKKSIELGEKIRTLTETQNYIKIPQIISSVNAEITLLKRTVEDLQYKRSEIEKTYTK
jgi:chromosome segregation ATPase